MGIVSGGGGGTFNGGTITTPLVINESVAGAITALTVMATDAPGASVTAEIGTGGIADVGLLSSGTARASLGIVDGGTADGQVKWVTTGSYLQPRSTSADADQFIEIADKSGNDALVYQAGGSLIFGRKVVIPDANLAASQFGLWLDDTNGAAKLMVKAKQANGAAVAPGLSGRDIATAPAVSAASTLALGTAYQNTLGYDVLLCIYLSVTVNTSGVLKLGVGPTTTPTQQTLVTGITSTGLWPVPIYLPNNYYALLSVTGTITVAVDGQIAMPI